MTDLASTLRRRRRLITPVCIALWAGAWIVSHIPSDHMPSTGIGDMTAHVLGYLVITVLLWLALAAHGRARMVRIIWSLLIGGGYGAFDELTQQFFGRSPELADWLANMAGAAAAVMVCEGLCHVRGSLLSPAENNRTTKHPKSTKD